MSMNTVSIDDIDRSCAEFIKKSSRKSFAFQDAVEYVVKETGAGTEDMDRIKNNVQMLLTNDETLLYHDDKAIHRKTFFKGAQFLITPSTFELDRGILFAGDRFAPFCNQDVFHDEYELFRLGEKKSFPIMQVTASVQSILPFHAFLGHAGIFDLICAESEDNRVKLRHCQRMEQAMVDMSVFNLSDFYQANKFRYRDGILVTVNDWTRCKFSIEYRPYEIFSNHHARMEWIAELEDALLKVCDVFDEYIAIHDQFAYAFHFAKEDGHNLLKQPIVSSIDYYYNMADITINTDSPDWYLIPVEHTHQPGMQEQEKYEHKCECEHHHQDSHEPDHECECGHHHQDSHGPDDHDTKNVVKDISPNDFSSSSGALDSLDAILEELNAPFGYIELYSMILDSLANAVEFSEFKESIISRIPNGFADDAQEAAFINFLEENWEICEETYRPDADASKIPYRTRLLELNEQRIDLATRLLTSGNEKRLKDMTPIMRRFYGILIETLAFLNSDSDLPESDELEDFESRIDDISDMWDDISNTFDEY